MITTIATLALGGLTVALPMEGKAQGTEITLGEVATLSGLAETELAVLEDLSLGYAPSPGYSRLLRSDQVLASIRRARPELEVHMVGRDACRVWPEVERVEPTTVFAAAEAELARVLGAADAAWEPVGELPAIEVPAGARRHELRARLFERQPRTGTVSVPVQVLVDGTVYRTVWTSWRLELFERRPVLVRAVNAGERLSADLFVTRRVTASASGAARPLTAGLVLGAVAARDLEAGSVVTDLDVHRPVVVESGGGVLLEVGKGHITARVPAQALESGAIGDRIRVRTLDGGRELTGTVAAGDLVKIDLGAR